MTSHHNTWINMAAASNLPYYACGRVVHGFGRGSKQLGIPTANYEESVVNDLPDNLSCGVYYGWASLEADVNVYKMVMSIGWNPQYQNIKKSMETHILHEFTDDFYGAQLHVYMTGFIRNEKKFNSIDQLIAEIKNDISIARSSLSYNDIEYYQFMELLRNN